MSTERVTLALTLLLTLAPALAASPDPQFLDQVNTPRSLQVERDRPVVIAVIDDGVLASHDWLREFIWTNPGEVPANRKDDDGNGLIDDVHGWDWSDGNANTNPPPHREGYDHGTHVAGIITRIARRALGETAPEHIRIMPVKTLADNAEPPILTGVYEAIDYAIDAGADIVLTAWGLAVIAPHEERVLDNVATTDALLIAAAGNFPDEQPQYPGAHPAALAVAALGADNQLSAQSNFGAFVDLSAPGEAILSAGAGSDGATLSLSGTSFAAAMVAGAAALVRLRHPDLTAEEVRGCLLSSATPLVDKRQRYAARMGAGALDIARAVECADFLQGEVGTKQRVTARGYLRPGRSRGAATEWLVEPAGEVKGLRFEQLQPAGKHGGGILSFHDLNSEGNDPVSSYPVQQLPAEVYVPSNRVRVSYQPARRESAPNLLLRYSSDLIDVRRLYCSGTQHISVPGRLSDGSGAEPYSYSTDCKWLISAPPGKRVHFRFTSMDTESRTDMVYFFNGDGTYAPIMAIFSGQELPPELTTWSNVVLVWFVTNGQNQGQGWETEFSFVDAE